ncbi:cullin family protein [Acanthamoeba castellanii str. Neff]|uniref:Cullin family protein n=1 Tax=Acanthamoeba castellanii (strain ATCC 30010 / Neff) TaxID=1257118 RepID=L8H0W0_ACACF|nr:cullin family protein [Acanthamoeba castellanii str. Neff]ELR19099.1 cullin family protein [Acanthamoeba castellanii str. Neff]
MGASKSNALPSRPSHYPDFDELELCCAELKSVTTVSYREAFSRYEGYLRSFARDYLEPQLESVGLCTYLAALVKCWEQFSIYTKSVIMLMQQLHYSDRYGPMAKQVFMKLFLQSDRLARELQRVLQEGRFLDDEETNHHIVSTLVLLSEIGYNNELFVKYFETPLIERCAADARLRLQTSSVTNYLAYEYVQEKVESEWESLFSSGNRQELRPVCALWLQIEDVVAMLKGKQLGSLDTLSVVNSMIDAYRYCHGMTSNTEDAGLISALQQGTAEALTVEWSLPKEEQQGRGRLVEEYLAHFCHRLLSKQSDKLFQADLVEEIVDGVTDLYRHCANKDIFVALYQRHLIKRLLLEGSSATEDRELAMLSRLKTATVRTIGDLSGLHRCDMAVREVYQSAELSARFKASPFAQGLSTDINVKVISSFLFPYQFKPVALPVEFLHAQERYTQFYTDLTAKSKKLFWIPALSSAVVSASFTKGKKEFRVSLHQASILFLFNDSSALTLNDILRHTKMDKEECALLVKQLVKIKLILSVNAGGDSNAETFQVHDAFANKRFSINLNAAQLKLAKGESDQARESALQSRRYSAQAAVVRIMKSRRVLTHNELVSETMAQLKFPFEIGWLKRVLEALISSGYMARTTRADQAAYEYLP